MSIVFVEPLLSGNAVRLTVSATTDSIKWRVLRKTTNDIVDENDPAAVIVYEGCLESIVDIEVVNGTVYYYQLFDYINSVWVSSVSVSVIPSATYKDQNLDVIDLLLRRLELGFAIEVINDDINPASGKVSVKSAPPEFNSTTWPVVSVHLDNDSRGESAIGEVIFPDIELDTTGWEESEGWLANISVSIIGWTVNSLQRNRLRKSIKRILLANFPVFESVGMELCSFNLQDSEDLQSYPTPVYMTNCSFTCLAPVRLSHDVSEIIDVQSIQKCES